MTARSWYTTEPDDIPHIGGAAEARSKSFNGHGPFDGFDDDQAKAFSWPQPKPLPSDLLPVAPFDLAFLPTSIRPWVADIADRMQCPQDFLGVSAMVALSAVVGRKIGVRPQVRTDWLEVPNLWGCIIARPGAMKSPAMAQTLAPLHRLERKAREENEAARAGYDLALEAFKIRKEEAGRKAKGILKGGGDIGDILDIAAPVEPAARRYVIMDSTYDPSGRSSWTIRTACAPSVTNWFRSSRRWIAKNTRRRAASS